MPPSGLSGELQNVFHLLQPVGSLNSFRIQAAPKHQRMIHASCSGAVHIIGRIAKIQHFLRRRAASLQVFQHGIGIGLALWRIAGRHHSGKQFQQSLFSKMIVILFPEL